LNFARLNHILIPDTKADRDRLRGTRIGRYLMRPAFHVYQAFSSEGRALFVLSLLAGVAGLDVQRLQNYWLWSVLCGLLVASLCVRRWFRLPDVSMRVEAPRRVMAGEQLELRILVHNASDQDFHHLRIERPILPWDGTWTDASPRIEELPRDGECSLTTHARFVARGPHHLDALFIQALVPGRLAQGPGVPSNGVRFMVVPRLANVSDLRLPRAQRSQPGGTALVSNAGDSLEVCGVRPYVPGDPIRDLHAVTWARLGSPAVRIYQQEAFTRVALVVDTSAHTYGEEHFEAALSLAAGVSAHLARGNVRVSVTLSGELHDPVLLGAGYGSLDRVLDMYAAAKPTGEFASEALEIRLKPELERISCALLIALEWDDSRRQLVHALRARGVSVRSFIVGPRDARPPEVGIERDDRFVPLRSILEAEELRL